MQDRRVVDLANDVDIANRSTVFDGYTRVDLYRLRYRRYDGRWSRPIEREVVLRGDAAAVLLYDPRLDQVVLIEQFRVSALAAGRNPWQLEVVAGGRKPRERFEDVARREALEEAGCSILGEIELIYEFMTSPGTGPDLVKLYCGRIDAAGSGGIHGVQEEDEDIRVVSIAFTEAHRLLTAGAVENCTTIVALQWLAVHRDRLRRDAL